MKRSQLPELLLLHEGSFALAVGDALRGVTVAVPAVGGWDAAEALHRQWRPMREHARRVQDLVGE